MFSSPEFWGTIGAAVVSAVASGVISGAKGAASAVKSCMSNYQNEIKELSQAVEHLKKEKIEKLEITIDEHLSKDQTQGLSVELKNINSSITGLSNNVENMGKDVAVLKTMQGTIQRLVDSDTAQTREIATLAADRRGDRSFIENINTALQHHKQGGHHVG